MTVNFNRTDYTIHDFVSYVGVDLSLKKELSKSGENLVIFLVYLLEPRLVQMVLDFEGQLHLFKGNMFKW